MKATLVLALASLACAASFAQQASPYAGQENREIKALSAQEVSDYQQGKGMGLAKAAELNGFAGPAHVLELAAPLRLTDEQRVRTQALFSSMQAKASSLGRALVDEERKLDRLFADRTVTAELLTASMTQIGSLQAKVRQAHLEAHLAQVAILTPEQNARYAQLRGYGGGQEHHHHH